MKSPSFGESESGIHTHIRGNTICVSARQNIPGLRGRGSTCVVGHGRYDGGASWPVCKPDELGIAKIRELGALVRAQDDLVWWLASLPVYERVRASGLGGRCIDGKLLGACLGSDHGSVEHGEEGG